MYKNTLFSCLCISLLITACGPQQPVIPTEGTATRDGYTEIPQQSVMEEEEVEQKAPSCVALYTDERALKMDNYTEAQVLSYTYDQGCVCIAYAYSGCGEREGLVLKRKNEEDEAHQPPKVHLSVLVENPGMCEAYFTDSICISTEKLKLIGNEVMLQFAKPDQNLLLQFQY